MIAQRESIEASSVHEVVILSAAQTRRVEAESKDLLFACGGRTFKSDDKQIFASGSSPPQDD